MNIGVTSRTKVLLPGFCRKETNKLSFGTSVQIAGQQTISASNQEGPNEFLVAGIIGRRIHPYAGVQTTELENQFFEDLSRVDAWGIPIETNNYGLLKDIQGVKLSGNQLVQYYRTGEIDSVNGYGEVFMDEGIKPLSGINATSSPADIQKALELDGRNMAQSGQNRPAEERLRHSLKIAQDFHSHRDPKQTVRMNQTAARAFNTLGNLYAEDGSLAGVHQSYPPHLKKKFQLTQIADCQRKAAHLNQWPVGSEEKLYRLENAAAIYGKRVPVPMSPERLVVNPKMLKTTLLEAFREAQSLHAIAQTPQQKSQYRQRALKIAGNYLEVSPKTNGDEILDKMAAISAELGKRKN